MPPTYRLLVICMTMMLSHGSLYASFRRSQLHDNAYTRVLGHWIHQNKPSSIFPQSIKHLIYGYTIDPFSTKSNLLDSWFFEKKENNLFRVMASHNGKILLYDYEKGMLIFNPQNPTKNKFIFMGIKNYHPSEIAVYCNGSEQNFIATIGFKHDREPYMLDYVIAVLLKGEHSTMKDIQLLIFQDGELGDFVYGLRFDQEAKHLIAYGRYAIHIFPFSPKSQSFNVENQYIIDNKQGIRNIQKNTLCVYGDKIYFIVQRELDFDLKYFYINTPDQIITSYRNLLKSYCKKYQGSFPQFNLSAFKDTMILTITSNKFYTYIIPFLRGICMNERIKVIPYKICSEFLGLGGVNDYSKKRSKHLNYLDKILMVVHHYNTSKCGHLVSINYNNGEATYSKKPLTKNWHNTSHTFSLLYLSSIYFLGILKGDDEKGIIKLYG